MAVLETLGIDPQIIIANIISFLLLLWLFKAFAYKPISGVMAERRNEIEQSFQRIEQETSRVQQAQADIDRRLTEMEAESRRRIEEAAREGSQLKDQILAEARQQAEQVKERGIQDIERERDKALQALREQVADLVAQATEKVLSESMTDERHRQMISRAIEQVETSRN